MNKVEKLLKTQIKLGYWNGFSMAMYPNQPAYEKIDVDFDKIWKSRNKINLYYHIPFCKSICPYCGFFAVAGNDNELKRSYIDKVNEQMKGYIELLDYKTKIMSICFGGGTPNFIPVELYYSIFETLSLSHLVFDENLEPSMEVSPELLTEEYLADLKQIGVRRLSLGVQSLDLSIRDSIHRNNLNIYELFDKIRKYDFNINIDLINGLYGQTPDKFMDTLKVIAELAPETISIYPLAGDGSSMLKADGQIMTNYEKYGLFKEYYEYLLNNGYRCESNIKFVKKNQSSTHQQKIYEYQGIDTLGIGCAARSYNYYTHYGMEHRFKQKNRAQLLEQYMNNDFRNLDYYGVRMNDTERKSRFAIYGVFMGIIDLEKYRIQFKSELIKDFTDVVEALINLNLAYIDEDKIYITKEGTVYTDIICQQFISENVKRKMKLI